VDVSAEMEVIRSNIRRAKDRRERRGGECLECGRGRASSAGEGSRCCYLPRSPSSRLLRPLAITCGLTLFHRFSGAAAFNFYAVSIFMDATVPDSFVDPHLAAVVVGAIQLLASR